MLKNCPHFLRGRLRESFNFALREWFTARLEGNVEAETRAWTFFGLVPVMLLHRLSARGLSTDLIRKAWMSPRPVPPHHRGLLSRSRRVVGEQPKDACNGAKEPVRS